MKPHGHYIRYSTGCRCEPCRTAWAVYLKQYRARLRARGLSEKHGEIISVDGGDTRTLLRCLLAAGVGKHGLARATGIARHTFTLVETGQSARVRPETAEKLHRLHWTIWRGWGPLRARCTCDMPESLRREWEAA